MAALVRVRYVWRGDYHVTVRCVACACGDVIALLAPDRQRLTRLPLTCCGWSGPIRFGALTLPMCQCGVGSFISSPSWPGASRTRWMQGFAALGRFASQIACRAMVDALNKAIARFGRSKIMNTVRGSQFTSFATTDRFRRSGVRISMDGKGRFLPSRGLHANDCRTVENASPSGATDQKGSASPTATRAKRQQQPDKAVHPI